MLFSSLGPPDELVSISPVVPGQYLVRAIATGEDKQLRVMGIPVTVPSGAACTAHLMNCGVTVEGNFAIVEFRAVGLERGGTFNCRLLGRQDQPEPCMSMWAA